MTRNFKIRSLFLMLLLLFSMGLSPLMAEDTPIEERTEKLNDIELKLEDILARKKSLQSQLKNKALSEEEVADLNQRLQTLLHQQKEFNALFEQTALGGIDLSLFAEPENAPEADTQINYDWQQEVLQILQPFFAQMQRATEKARTKDLLIEDTRELAKKIELAEFGLNTLQNINREDLNPKSLAAITKIEEQWLDKIKSLEHQKNIVDLKLQDLTDSRPFLVKLWDNLWHFITEEGVTLVIASVAAIIFYYLFRQIILLYSNYQQRDRKRTLDFKWRFVMLLLQAANFLLTLTIFLVILHTSGNLMLFGIVVFALLMLVVSFRAKFPLYLQKLRIFLNLGQAREGERIIYADIPWEIKKISLNYVYLTNPLLDNGTVRVTIDLLDKFYSRETLTDELWFPSRKNDILLLPDKRIIKVLRQTPESIYLDHDGSTIVMPTAEFYKLKFSNLSRGYSLTLNFTLEEPHPENPLTFAEVEESMINAIKAEFAHYESRLPNGVKNITLYLRQLLSGTTTSYQIIVEMAPNAAKYYLLARTALNRAVITNARKNGWSILLTENI